MPEIRTYQYNLTGFPVYGGAEKPAHCKLQPMASPAQPSIAKPHPSQVTHLGGHIVQRAKPCHWPLQQMVHSQAKVCWGRATQGAAQHDGSEHSTTQHTMSKPGLAPQTSRGMYCENMLRYLRPQHTNPSQRNPFKWLHPDTAMLVGLSTRHPPAYLRV